MRLGGTKDLIQAVKAEGRQPGPMSVWVTGGAIKWGTGNLDTHYAECKAAGVDPLVLFWFWGDDISTAAINNGVKDQYQGTWKTKAAALALAQAIGQKAQAAGVSPIVAIEHEFAQEGLETDPSAFAPYFDSVANVIKAACPSARIAFCCPIWEDEALIGKTYAAQIAKADMVASQTLLFPPQHAAHEFTNAGANFSVAFANLRRLAPGKPAGIIDLGFSSYGGAYSKTAPFPGGNGYANEPMQKAALDSIAAKASEMGLDFAVYRSLRDAANFDVANYGGYSERHVGVVRSDGSRKPAYASLMALASPQPPPPPPLLYTESDMAAMRARVGAAESGLAAAQASNDALASRVARAKGILSEA